VSLVGFKAQNHAQQVLVRGPRRSVDDRGTTWEDFAEWQKRFAFTLDVAASHENAKCQRFYTAAEEGLERPWGGRVWCNPPYSDIEPWVAKAHQEISRLVVELIVMLLPANRTEQGWWQRQVEPYRRSGAIEVEFLPGRLRFLKPGQKHIGPNERPPFGCCLVIWR
jgi:phage N-6-adenine-methyltransferase